jgi:DNA-binding MarR family transcriptional regulator
VRTGCAENWRAVLRGRAEQVWRTGDPTFLRDESATTVLSQALGPLAEDALGIVEAYTLGARRVSGSAEPSAEFGSRLLIILNGVEASFGERTSGGEYDAPPHMIQSDIWQVLRKVRESAELAYSRERGMIELDRRILFLVQGAGPLVPAEISGAVGVDKAQVSRSVKRLLELRLVDREQIRAPLRLTAEGERVGKRMLRLADLRHRELTIEVSDEELSEFYDTIEVLLERAVALYEQERHLAAPGGKGQRSSEPSRKGAEPAPGERIVLDRTRIVAPLMTLSAYFSRSGGLAFKRLTGLSRFEALVLSEIGNDPPVDWSTLVSALDRDHSQAGRTINALMERGLVEREGKPGRRHGRFFPTGGGACLHQVIQDAGRERSAFLLAPLAAEQRARFLATFDKVRRNAVAQLERERAYAELAGG